MSDISIGTVRSEVRIGLDKLGQDVAEAKSALASLAASLNSAVEAFSAKMTTDATLAAAAQERSASASVERIAQQQRAAGEQQLRQQKADLEKAEQQAKQSQERALAAAKQIGGQLQMIGGAALLALGAASKVGMDFETTLVHVANNTTMTTADIQQMTAAVKDLGRSSGADLTQLAEGFMHASNFGFTAAESTQILTEAMKSAVSTGGDVGKTTEILANVMHEFSIPVGEAGRAMNGLHLAAAQGNATLEQFVESGGPAFAMAANLGVGMTETAAAMSALTKHGFTAAEAATQVRNILSHIAEPAGKTKDILEQLSKTTGVNLVRDFSLAGLQGKGMAGILDDIKLAAERAHVSTSDLMMKLVPAMRGGIGAMALAGTAAKDFKQELVSLADAMAGKVDPTTTAYTRQQATLTAQTNKARNELTLMSSDIEKALMPALRGLIGEVSTAARWFSSLSPAVKSATVQAVAFAGAAALVTGTVLKTVTAVAELKAALTALGGMKIALPNLAGLAAAGGGLGGTLMAGGGLLAAGGGIGYMMHRTVWSGVQEAQNRAFTEHRNAQEQTPQYRNQRLTFLQKDLAGLKSSLVEYAGMPSKLKELNARMMQETAEMRGMFGDEGGNDPAPKKTVKPGKTVNVNDFLAAAGGGGGGGGSSKAAKQAGRDAEELKQHLEEVARASALVQDKLFELGHTETETKMRTAWKEVAEQIGEGVPKMQAYLLYFRQVAEIQKEASAEKARRDNEALSQSIRDVVENLKLEAEELAGVQRAADEMEADAQRAFDEHISSLFAVQEATRTETEAVVAYWKEQADAAEQSWHDQVQASIEASKAQREERDSTEQYHKDNPDVGKKPATQFQQILKSMAGNVESILGGAFERVFMGDTKNLFQDLLKSFEQMLAQMAAKALASGIMNLLTGGAGGFMGGVLGSFGFDDAGNDRTARHWGFDFAGMFSQGMNDHSNSRMAAAAPGGYGGGGDTHININMGGVQMRNDMDMNAVGAALARHIVNVLPARPGTGARR